MLAGGGFPVIVKGAGVIGVHSRVSGLPEREDHGVIVDALCDHLGIDRKALALPPSRRETMTLDPKSFLTSIFEAAVAAADPERTIRNHLPAKPKGRTIVIGAGKGSAQMAAAFEKAWDGPLDGLVVTRYGYGAPCERIEVIEAAHPVPDEAGLDGVAAAARNGAGLTEDDLVVALISGGGSALLPSPAERADARRRDRRQRGAACLRRADLGDEHDAQACLDDQGRAAGGGGLAGAGRVAGRLRHSRRQSGAGRVRPDHRRTRRRRADALDVVEAYGMKLPDAVMAHLQLARCRRAAGRRSALCPQRRACHRLGRAFRWRPPRPRRERQGVEAVILSDSIEGEARDVGSVHAAIAREVATRNRPFAKPVLILSGGETTVTLRGEGQGRAQQRVPAVLRDRHRRRRRASMRSPPTRTASTARRTMPAPLPTARPSRGCAPPASTPRRMLAGNDAWTAFNAVGDLFVPGPTGTNVNDLRAILVR